MIVLFTTDCPKCHTLEQQLTRAKIDFTKENNIQEIIDEGFMEAPILKVADGQYLNFSEAIKWIRGAA